MSVPRGRVLLCGLFAAASASLGCGVDVHLGYVPGEVTSPPGLVDGGATDGGTASAVRPVVQLSTGTTMDCARHDGGTVSCWHFILTGGSPTVWTRAARYWVPGVRNATDVAAGNGYACAALRTGEVACWRQPTAMTTTVTVAAISGITDAVAVASRPAVESACALRSGGTVACWGSLDFEGAAVQRTSATPLDVSGLTGVVALVNRCARLSTGGLACWSGGSGERRPPTNDGTPQPPTAMPTLGAAVVSFGVSQSTILEVTASGDVFGVGSPSLLNRSYLNGNPQIYPTPTQVLAVAGIKQLSVGAGHACGLKGDGTVLCWGDNIDGAIGSANRFDSAPRTIAGLSDVVALSSDMASSSRTCALRATGKVACWGSGFGPAPVELPDP